MLVGMVLVGQGQAVPEPVSLSLVTAVRSYQPGKPFLVGVRLAASPNGYVFYRNPGDSGEPVRIQWQVPRGWKVSEPMWQAPEVLVSPQRVNYGYRNEATVLVWVTPPAEAKAPAPLLATVNWAALRHGVVERGHRTLSSVLESTETPLGETVEGKHLQALATTAPKEMEPGQAAAEVSRDEVRLSASIPQLGRQGAKFSVRFFPYEPGVVANEIEQWSEVEGQTVTLRMAKCKAFDRKRKRLRGALAGRTETATGGVKSFLVELDVPLELAADTIR